MNPSILKYIGYIAISIIYGLYFILAFIGYVGINFLTLATVGFLSLFAYVVITKIQNKEDKYYEDNVDI